MGGNGQDNGGIQGQGPVRQAVRGGRLCRRRVCPRPHPGPPLPRGGPPRRPALPRGHHPPARTARQGRPRRPELRDHQVHDQGHDLRRRPSPDRRPPGRLAGVKGHKDFVIAADPFLPVEKDLERRDFRANSLAVRLSDGTVIDPFEGRTGHPGPPPPRDQPGRVPRRSAPRPPGGPVRFGSRLPDRSGDLRDGQGHRPLRPERRTGERGAFQDPPRFARSPRSASRSFSGSGPSRSSSPSSTP